MAGVLSIAGSGLAGGGVYPRILGFRPFVVA